MRNDNNIIFYTYIVLLRNLIIVSVPFVQKKVVFVQNIEKYREELSENTLKVFNRINKSYLLALHTLHTLPQFNGK